MEVFEGASVRAGRQNRCSSPFWPLLASFFFFFSDCKMWNKCTCESKREEKCQRQGTGRGQTHKNPSMAPLAMFELQVWHGSIWPRFGIREWSFTKSSCTESLGRTRGLLNSVIRTDMQENHLESLLQSCSNMD